MSAAPLFKGPSDFRGLILADTVSLPGAEVLLRLPGEDAGAARGRVVLALRNIATYVATANGGVAPERIYRVPAIDEIDWTTGDVEPERLGLDDYYAVPVPLRLRRDTLLEWRRQRYETPLAAPAPVQAPPVAIVEAVEPVIDQLPVEPVTVEPVEVVPAEAVEEFPDEPPGADPKRRFATGEIDQAYLDRRDYVFQKYGRYPAIAEDQRWNKRHGLKSRSYRKLRSDHLPEENRTGGHPKTTRPNN
jgi:hypothetical protein